MNVDTPLPQSGVGFVTNNRGANGEFQFGQRSTIDVYRHFVHRRLVRAGMISGEIIGQIFGARPY